MTVVHRWLRCLKSNQEGQRCMLHSLPKITEKSAKRVGRGSSSGRGKTAGRGQKGQKARNSVPWFMTGGSRRNRFSKSTPQIRGYRNRVKVEKAVTIPTLVIERFYNNGEVVTIETLIEKGIISKKDSLRGVKIVKNGDLTKKVSFEVPASKSVLL